MQEQKAAIQFNPDEEVVFTLSFDQPKIGESANGPWNLYGCKINGQDEKFFASEKLHQKIQQAGLKKGSVGTITLKAIIGENNKAYKEYKLFVNRQEIILNGTTQSPQAKQNVPQQSNDVMGALRKIYAELAEIKQILIYSEKVENEMNEMKETPVFNTIGNTMKTSPQSTPSIQQPQQVVPQVQQQPTEDEILVENIPF